MTNKRALELDAKLGHHKLFGDTIEDMDNLIMDEIVPAILARKDNPFPGDVAFLVSMLKSAKQKVYRSCRNKCKKPNYIVLGIGNEPESSAFYADLQCNTCGDTFTVKIDDSHLGRMLVRVN